MLHLLTYTCGVVTHCFLICPVLVLQAKRSNIEHAWAQHIMQVAGARDTLARQVEQWKREHNAGQKRSFWEVCTFTKWLL